MNFKKLPGFSRRLNTRQLCFLFAAGLVSGIISGYSFEDLKFVGIVVTGTLLFVLRHPAGRYVFLKAIVMVLLGWFAVLSFTAKEMKPSLWARSTETTLTPAKMDSLVKTYRAEQGKVNKRTSEEKKDLSPKATAGILFLLLSIVGLGSLYLTAVGTMVGIVMFFFFLALGIFSIAGAIYFLHRIFRKEPFKKRLERTKADNKKESKLYFRILGLTLLAFGIAGLIAIGGLFF